MADYLQRVSAELRAGCLGRAVRPPGFAFGKCFHISGGKARRRRQPQRTVVLSAKPALRKDCHRASARARSLSASSATILVVTCPGSRATKRLAFAELNAAQDFFHHSGLTPIRSSTKSCFELRFPREHEWRQVAAASRRREGPRRIRTQKGRALHPAGLTHSTARTMDAAPQTYASHDSTCVLHPKDSYSLPRSLSPASHQYWLQKALPS